jgi:hypothetical protein
VPNNGLLDKENVEYYLAIKNKITSFAGKWRELANNMLSK